MSKSKQPLNLKDTLIAKLEQKKETIPENTIGRVKTMTEITNDIISLRKDNVDIDFMTNVMSKYGIELDNELIIDEIPLPTGGKSVITASEAKAATVTSGEYEEKELEISPQGIVKENSTNNQELGASNAEVQQMEIKESITDSPVITPQNILTETSGNNQELGASTTNVEPVTSEEYEKDEGVDRRPSQGIKTDTSDNQILGASNAEVQQMEIKESITDSPVITPQATVTDTSTAQILKASTTDSARVTSGEYKEKELEISHQDKILKEEELEISSQDKILNDTNNNLNVNAQGKNKRKREGSIHIDENSPRPNKIVRKSVEHDSLATRIEKRRKDVKVKGTNKKKAYKASSRNKKRQLLKDVFKKPKNHNNKKLKAKFNKHKHERKHRKKSYCQKIHQSLNALEVACEERKNAPVSGVEGIINQVQVINSQQYISKSDMTGLKTLVDNYNEAYQQGKLTTEQIKENVIPEKIRNIHGVNDENFETVYNEYREKINTELMAIGNQASEKNDQLVTIVDDLLQTTILEESHIETLNSKIGEHNQSNPNNKIAMISEEAKKKVVTTVSPSDSLTPSNEKAQVNNPEDYFYTHPGVDVKIDIDLTSSLSGPYNKAEVNALLKDYIIACKANAIANNSDTDTVNKEQSFSDWLESSTDYDTDTYIKLQDEKIVESIDKAKATFSETLRTNADLQNLYSTQPIGKGYFQFKNGSYDSSTSTYKVRSKVRFSFAGGPRKAAESLMTEGLASTGLPATFNITGGHKIQKEKIKEIAKICKERGVNPDEIKIKSDFGEQMLGEITEQTLDPNLVDTPLCDNTVKGGLAHAFVEEYKGEADLKRGNYTPEAMKFYNNHQEDFTAKSSEIEAIQNNKQALEKIGSNEYSMFSLDPSNIKPLSEQQQLDIASGKVPRNLNSNQRAAVAKIKFDGNNVRKEYFSNKMIPVIIDDLANDRIKAVDIPDNELKKEVMKREAAYFSGSSAARVKIKKDSPELYFDNSNDTKMLYYDLQRGVINEKDLQSPKNVAATLYAVVYEKLGDPATAQSFTFDTSSTVAMLTNAGATKEVAAEAVNQVHTSIKKVYETNDTRGDPTYTGKYTIDLSNTQAREPKEIRNNLISTLTTKIEEAISNTKEAGTNLSNASSAPGPTPQQTNSEITTPKKNNGG